MATDQFVNGHRQTEVGGQYVTAEYAGSAVSGTNPLPVSTAVETTGTDGHAATDAQTTVATTKTIPSARSVYIETAYGATGAHYLWVVFNAANNTAATAALADSTLRYRLAIGNRCPFLFDPTALCTRIDYATDAGTCDVSIDWIA